MKRNILTVVALILVASCIGCGQLKNEFKHMHSSITGLDRKITLYDANGHTIKEWRTRAQIEDQGGTVHFIVDGKAVTISGTFTIEEQ